MMKVVVAFDGSAQSVDALECLSWWPASDLDVLLVMAVSGPALNEVGDAVEMEPREENRAHELIERTSKNWQEKGVRMVGRVVGGSPADAVLRAANEAGADLILAGRRGLGLARTLLLGSVSTEILDRATCPVLLTH